METSELSRIEQFRAAHRTMKEKAKPFFERALEYDAAAKMMQVDIEWRTRRINECRAAGVSFADHEAQGKLSAQAMMRYLDERDEMLRRAEAEA